ncbi:hypothetical protein JXB37_04080 [candidate division WOR-3 bacterium]|nr:hypothetical protein [candidate division WOR-3 bacterium]
MMRRVVLAGLLLAALASGQLLERYISLADPLAVSWVGALAANPNHGLLYVCGGRGILVVDTRTLGRRALLARGTTVTDACFHAGLDRLYALGPDTLVVFDGLSQDELRRVPLSPGAQNLYLDEAGDRLLVFHHSDPRLLSFYDCRADSVQFTIRLDSTDDYWVMDHNPVRDKAYLMDSHGMVTVVDLGTGAVLGWLDSEGVNYLACDPAADKVYVSDHWTKEILVLDGATDSVVGRIDVEDEFGRSMVVLAVQPGLGKLYAFEVEEGPIAVFDTRGDSLLHRVVGASSVSPGLVAVDEAHGRLYAYDWARRGLASVDCRTDSALSMAPWKGYVDLLAYDPVQDRVWAYDEVEQLRCVDPVGGIVCGVVGPELPSDLECLRYDPVRDRLYCCHLHPSMLMTVHPGTGRVLGMMPGPGCHLSDLVAVTQTGRVHAGIDIEYGDSWLASLDPGDSSYRVLLPERARRWVEPSLPLPSLRKTVYQVTQNVDSQYRYVFLLDWLTETPGPQVPVEGFVRSAAVDPGRGLVYLALDNGTVIALDPATGLAENLLEYQSRSWVLSFDPGLDRLYLVDPHRVQVYDPGRAMFVAEFGYGRLSGSGPVACDTVRHLLYCGNADSVLVADGLAGAVLDNVAVGFHPEGLHLDPESGRALAVGPGGVAFIDPDTRVVATVPLELGVGVHWDAGNGRAYVAVDDTLIAVVRDTMLLVGQGEPPPATLVQRYLTLVVGESGSLVDVTGRKLLDLLPGRNDLGGVAPGVYFVREGSRGQGSEGSRVRKVIVQR